MSATLGWLTAWWSTCSWSGEGRRRLEAETATLAAAATARRAHAAWTEARCFHQRCRVKEASSTCLDCGHTFAEVWGAAGEQPPPLPPPVLWKDTQARG